MTALRLRLTLPSGPLDLANARAALVGALWVWSESGEVASSNENAAALDDLEWLGVEPDAMASAPKLERYQAAAATLEDAGVLYRCYCTSGHYREMPGAPPGAAEPVIYDGRCRRLKPAEREALEQAGRKFRYRLSVPSELPDLPAPWCDQPLPDADRVALEVDGTPSPAFAAAIDDHAARANATVVDSDAQQWLVERALIERGLDRDLPQLQIVPAFRGCGLSIAELREGGHPRRALLNALLYEIWRLPEGLLQVELEDTADSFSLSSLTLEGPTTSPLDEDGLRELSRETLAQAETDDLTDTLVEHLTRRGYNVLDFDREWQVAYATAVRSSLQTLTDAESLAGVLTAPTVDYDRSVERVLSRPGAAEALDWLGSVLEAVPDGDLDGWQEAIQAYRQQSEAPGRALSTVRRVMTGLLEGPSLGATLALLGHERCKERLEKARRHLP